MNIMYIGHNLARERAAKEWSQEAVAAAAGMSQSNYSNIELNLQPVRPKMIETFAKIFEVPVENITAAAPPGTVNIEHQTNNGQNSGTNFINHSEGEVQALKDLIETLKSQIQRADVSTGERVLELKERIHGLEEDVRYWRSKAGHPPQ